MNCRIFLVCMLISSTAIVARAQTSSYGELQAAYLFNFAKYIRWPGESDVFVIGVAGEADILSDLDMILRDKKIGGQPIEVRRVKHEDDYHACRMVYLPESESKKVARLTVLAKQHNILIVTEEDLIKKGATISFVIDDDLLRFKLNKTALLESGLQASDGLLKLALEP